MERLTVLFRFLLSVIICATLVSCVGRIFSDFDEPGENDPHDLIRGVGVWTVAVLLAFLNELIIHRRKKIGQ